MSLVLTGKNMNLFEDTKDYIERKVQKFDRFLPDITETRVEISKESTKSTQDKFIAEITVQTKQKILRSEERSYDLHVAIDSAVNKLNSQIARLKGKRKHRRQGKESIRLEGIPALTEEVLDQLEEDTQRQIVRTKQFAVIPMDEEEAIEQMQLLAHDFFVFFNANSGRINVLYKRADKNYGLLDPIIA